MKELPQKREKDHSLKVAIENDCYDGFTEEKAYFNGLDKGYNACVDDILKGSEEE